MGKQSTFFATGNDIINLMSRIETTNTVKYVEMGMFDSNNFLEYDSIGSIANIGYTDYGNWISLDKRFMIIEKQRNVIVREVPQKKGDTKYAVDPMLNPISLELSTGGVYSAVEHVLVAGRLATADYNGFSKQLYDSILKEMRKSFKKIGSVLVGPEAYEKLNQGWRLTTNEKSPKEYDLVIS